MKAAIVKDEKIVNIAAASREFAEAQGWIVIDNITPEPQIGWAYDGSVFIEPEPEPITPYQVAAERDRRLHADFEFHGVMYQRNPISVQRIAGASQLAALAIAAGAQEGDLLWHGGSEPFGWIASNDTVTPMDAQTVLAFGSAAASREMTLIFAARALRQMEPIPADYTDDKWWP